MASRLLRVFRVATNPLKSCYTSNNGITYRTFDCNNLAKVHVPLVQSVRTTKFFTRRPAEQLWKSVTSVSNAGRRRGRAKGVARRRDLNKGQSLGSGKVNMQFPGLNAPVIRGRELLRQEKLPDDPKREESLIKLRNEMSKRRHGRIHPLDRGWSGGKMGGKKLGPPDPYGEETFEGFESWVLEMKLVTVMTSNFGRKSKSSAFVVTGNRNGMAGFAMCKANDARAALKTAKNRAARKLIHVERHDNRTVVHDFFTQFGQTKIYVQQKHEGYGLVCHRAIKTCCEALGIKDLYAKVEGSIHYQNITKAFFIGLLKQKSYQQMADEKRLHLVEFKPDRAWFPTILASPAVVRKPEEVPTNEVLDFKQYLMDERVVLKRPRQQPFYTRLPSWTVHLRKQERHRNQDQVRLRMYAEHGELRSFLTDKYPEAKPQLWRKKKKQEEAAEQY